MSAAAIWCKAKGIPGDIGVYQGLSMVARKSWGTSCRGSASFLRYGTPAADFWKSRHLRRGLRGMRGRGQSRTEYFLELQQVVYGPPVVLL